MQNKKLENSVRSLLNLYTVTIGIALTLAVGVVVDPKDGLASATRVSLMLFVAFVATLIPFFHGALRHLDDVYVENDSAHIRKGALIVDFVLLLLHALAFLVLAQLLKRPGDFAWFLTFVLGLDVVWGLIAYLASSSWKGTSTAEGKWAIINVVFVSVAVAYLYVNDVPVTGFSGDESKLAVLVVIACLMRSTVDYVWCRAFYFPEP